MTEMNVNQQRLVSLDAMRGFVMFLLLGGGEIGHAGFLSALFAAIDHPWAQTLYHQLQYSGWSDANHVKDLIRPLFIFVVGVAMPYSFGKRLSLGDSKRKVFGHVLKRAAILFLLGTIAGGHLLALDRSKFYLVNNVLEEIAIGYLVAAMFLLNFSVRGQLMALVAMLLGYWALIVLVPVPGHGAGIIWLLGGALVCLVLSLAWSRWYPMIVSLTTGSWVLFVGAAGMGLSALFYLVSDIWGFRKSVFFFVVIGSNSIAVHMAAHLFDFRNIGNIFVKVWTTNHYVGVADGVCGWIGPGPWSNFVEAFAAFVVIWLIMLWMYRTKTFIKV